MPTVILQTSRYIRRYELDDFGTKPVVDAMERFKKDFFSGPVNAKLIRVPGHEVLSDLAIPYDQELLLVKTVEPVILSQGGRLVEAVDKTEETI